MAESEKKIKKPALMSPFEQSSVALLASTRLMV
jgi:hypothetical protein